MSQTFKKKYVVTSMTSLLLLGAVQVPVHAETSTQDTTATQHEEAPSTDTSAEETQPAVDEPAIDIGEAVPPTDEENEASDASEEIESEQQNDVIEEDPSTPETENPVSPTQGDSGTAGNGTTNHPPSSETQQDGGTYTPQSNQSSHGATGRGTSAVANINSGFKYNPVAAEIAQQMNIQGHTNHPSLQTLGQKATFRQNQFLNRVQQQSDYFRFQSFKPLSARGYYENLDKQVMGLIAGEIGAMPDLKKKDGKAVASHHQEDKEQQIKQDQMHTTSAEVEDEKEQNEKSKNSSYKWLISGLIGIVLAGALYRLVQRREH